MKGFFSKGHLKTVKRLILLFLLVFLFPLFLLFLYILDEREGAYYKMNDFFKTANPPNAATQEIQWKEGSYTLYFVDRVDKESNNSNHALYSIQSDGTNKQKIIQQKDIWDFFLIQLDSQKKILFFSSEGVFLIDEDGNNKQTISTDFSPSNPKISPDRLRVAFVNSPPGYPKESSGKIEVSDVIHILNIKTASIEKTIGKKDLFGFVLLDDMFWFNDSKRLLLRTMHYVPGPTLSQIVIYDLANDRITKVGEFTHSNIADADRNRGLSEFVNLGDLAIPEPNNYPDRNYTLQKVTSPDGINTADIKSGNIYVNGNEVMHWNHYHWRYNPSCYILRWFSDNVHIGARCSDGFRIIEVATKKTALLPLDASRNISDVKWYGQEKNIFYRSDWK